MSALPPKADKRDPTSVCPLSLSLIPNVYQSKNSLASAELIARYNFKPHSKNAL